MFGRDAEKLKSFLGSESEFQGELVSRGVLRMDGLVNGRIRANQVIITETARIIGEVLARKIIVGGRVEGTLRASEVVEITPKGRVRGEIFTKRLMVMDGGEFNGHVEMKAGESNVLEFESRDQEAVSGKG
jgi:cytoskeletal protein CcmA (bactofilin family)